MKKGLLPESFEFAGLRAGKEGKDPKAEKLIKLPAWQELRLALKKAGLETEWQGMAGAAISGDPTQLDAIARVLSVFKDGAEVETELRKLKLPGGDKMIDALSEISFDKFHALSLKALRKIVPHMEAGLRYDEACVQAGYHHSQLHVAGAGEHKYLPPFYSHRDQDGRMVFNEDLDVPKNPVVLRALNQARKVVNALIRHYGSPSAVHIEMARDLSRPLDERRKVEKEQLEYRDRNEKDKGLFAEQFGQLPKGLEFEKWRLYREQQGKCAYSLAALDLDRLLEPGYAEVDHALPYSRSYDDSKNNKVLVLAKENRDKGNRTPYEYLGGTDDSPRWRQFAAYVEGNKAYRLAKRSRLLRKNFGADEASEFKERNLNDTRYICKFFKNYVERYLQLAQQSALAGRRKHGRQALRGVIRPAHRFPACSLGADKSARRQRPPPRARCRRGSRVQPRHGQAPGRLFAPPGTGKRARRFHRHDYRRDRQPGHVPAVAAALPRAVVALPPRTGSAPQQRRPGRTPDKAGRPGQLPTGSPRCSAAVVRFARTAATQ